MQHLLTRYFPFYSTAIVEPFHNNHGKVRLRALIKTYLTAVGFGCYAGELCSSWACCALQRGGWIAWVGEVMRYGTPKSTSEPSLAIFHTARHRWACDLRGTRP